MRELLGRKKEGLGTCRIMICSYMKGKYEKAIGGFADGGDCC